MEGTATTTTTATLTVSHPLVAGDSSNSNASRRRPRPPKPNKPQAQAQAHTRVQQSQEGDQPQPIPTAKPARQPRPPRRQKEAVMTPSNEAGTSSSVAGGVGAAARPGAGDANSKLKPRPPRKRKPAPTTSGGDSATHVATAAGTTNPASQLPPGGRNRRANFGAGLTKPEKTQEKTQEKAQEKKPPKSRLPQGDDLTSALTRALSTPPYPDCPICFSAIRPDHAIWSCSPSPFTPIVTSSETQVKQYCWTAFHVRCIRSWAEKSVKEIEAAWRARGEMERKGDWRCPGCQAKREVVPSGYWCFCHSTPEPKLTRLITPHSCGNSCSRPRESGCGHPCPLACHPGPCPPCQVTTHLKCYCPKQKILSFRCGVDAKGKRTVVGERDLSCGSTCGRILNCGKHACERVCHPNECGRCEEREVVRCYCGKETKDVACGESESVECFVEGEEPWIGRFACENVCERPFDCGTHKCQKPCHPPSSKPAPCPRSPSKITHCPCGRCTVAPSPSSPASSQTNSNSNPSQYTFPARLSCADPIPTCTSPCSKTHSACGHPCQARCHEGPCPPCVVRIVRPCRCGATTKSLVCYEVQGSSSSQPGGGGGGEKEILCDKPCNALRACGRHRCRRLCCPLASIALAQATGKKGKKRGGDDAHEMAIGEEQGGLHECDVVCGKLLSCGNHRCERRDHKGPCGRCLRSSFEELICPCGRTIYEPPIPCGTRMECHYPCARPPPACGHPAVPHECHAYLGVGAGASVGGGGGGDAREGGHDQDPGCPLCPHLTTKRCACGKKEVNNVRCSLESDKVSCGSVCGKLMKCGFHHCERLCHADGPDGCGPCTAVCGKARKACLPNHHPCTLPCHAPSSCPETDPCQALVVLTCPCGRLKQSVHCGRTIASPPSSGSLSSSWTQAPKCNNDCQLAKRNARLADALGIKVNLGEKDPDGISKVKGGQTTYGEELAGFARAPANAKFVGMVERAFADFVGNKENKRTQVLPHMPVERRKFVHDLAAVYRMDTQMVDQEPHRSVQLLRRIDTRIPTPLLSQFVASSSGSTLGSAAPSQSLGRLADFRSLSRGGGAGAGGVGGGAAAAASAMSWRAGATGGGGGGSGVRAPTPNGGATTGPRGWTSVVAPKPTSTSTASVTLAGGVTAGSSSSGSRTVSPAGIKRPSSSSSSSGVGVGAVGAAVSPPTTTSEPVPDSWEDDV